MGEISTLTFYSIASVSKLSGISCHALRAWERRYGFPVPTRAETGHRRYSKDQIDTVRYLAMMAQAGHSIGQLITEYKAGRLIISADARSDIEERPPWSTVVDLLCAGEMNAAEDLIDRLTGSFSAIDSIERLIEPALVDIGERWFRGETRVFQERFATTLLLGRLEGMLDRARRDNRDPHSSVLVGTVEGDRHQGGLMMISVALELAGCRALPIGADVPVEELRAAVESWRPDAAAISFALSRNIYKRFETLSTIRDVPVFVGGRSLINHQGLARIHGLIPMVGPLRSTVGALVEEVRRRKQAPG